jgi:DNA-3-methyladenine glycosylase II
MTTLDVTDPRQLSRAVKALAKECHIIRAAHEFVGVPEWRTRQGDYAGLARIIAYQQLSTKAAGTIWGRVEVLLGKVTPKAVLAADFDSLRACGMSRPKISHIRSIAEAVESGALNLKRVAKASDAEAQAELVAVKGIGPWTAKMFLIFGMRRPDVLPVEDLGLREGLRVIHGRAERPSMAEAGRLAARWSPWATVGTVYAWNFLMKQGNASLAGESGWWRDPAA